MYDSTFSASTNLFFGLGVSAVRPYISVEARMAAAQILGLMGHAGCGKTTLAKLLLRRARPDRGSVSVDGVDIHDFDRSYNEQVTLLSSEPVVFNGTVFENIAYGLVGRSSGTRAEEDDVIQASVKLN